MSLELGLIFCTFFLPYFTRLVSSRLKISNKKSGQNNSAQFHTWNITQSTAFLKKTYNWLSVGCLLVFRPVDCRACVEAHSMGKLCVWSFTHNPLVCISAFSQASCRDTSDSFSFIFLCIINTFTPLFHASNVK